MCAHTAIIKQSAIRRLCALLRPAHSPEPRDFFVHRAYSVCVCVRVSVCLFFSMKTGSNYILFEPGGSSASVCVCVSRASARARMRVSLSRYYILHAVCDIIFRRDTTRCARRRSATSTWCCAIWCVMDGFDGAYIYTYAVGVCTLYARSNSYWYKSAARNFTKRILGTRPL